MKRIVSLLLAFAMVCTLLIECLPQSALTAEASSTTSYSSTAEITAKLNSWKSKLNGKYWNYYDRSQWDSKRNEVESNLKAIADNKFLEKSNPTNAELGVTASACSGDVYTSGCRSNYFSGGWQCFGFAWWIEYALFGSTYQFNSSDWNVYSGSSLNDISLQPGDLVRVNNHSIVVSDVSNGNLNCVEAWGGSGCKISWSPGFNWSQYTTASSMLSATKNNGGTVYRYKYIGEQHADTPNIRYWLSDSEYGDYPDEFKEDNRYYFCYRLYDSVTDKNWDEVASSSYSVKLTYYNPDGSVKYSHTFTNDQGWISDYFDVSGTYKCSIEVSGIFDFSDTLDFTIKSNQMHLYTSESSVDLVLRETESKTIDVWYDNPIDGYWEIYYSCDNTNVSCSWGEWNNGVVPLTITANNEGTASIMLYVLDENEDILNNYITIPVTVTRKTCTISYNANGGTGAPSSQTTTDSVVVPNTIPYRFGYTFLGWSTSSTATWSVFEPGESFTPPQDLTLYAVWEAATDISTTTAKEVYGQISFGGQDIWYVFDSSVFTSYQFVSYASSCDLHITLYDAYGNWVASDDDSGEGYEFDLKHTMSDGATCYLLVQSYYSDAVGDYYLIASKGNFIIYSANGGTNAPDSHYCYTYMGDVNLSEQIPTRTGYTFLGWSENQQATSADYQPGGSFSSDADTTLYAVWQKGCPGAHNYSTTVTIPPTCTAQGYTTYTCTDCGNTYKDSYTNALGHSYTYKVTTNPTTSATGVLTGTCSKCSGTTTVTLPKLNTTDYSYSVTTPASCTGAGVGTYTWKTTTYGSFKFDVSIAAKGHTYTSKVTAPTCTAQGYTTYTCTCGHSYKDSYTNALGHSYDYKVTTAPTTSATGVLTGTCSKCSGTTTVTLPKLNTTDYTYSVKTAATCTAAGTGQYTWKTTTYGTYKFDVTIPATGHSYTSKVTAPTCTAQGCTTYTCTCGHSYKDSYTNALGHSYSYKVTTNPTTSATGVLTGTCSKCSGTTTVTLPKLNTTDYTYSVTKEPSYTATGVGTYTWKTTTYGTFKFDVSIEKLIATLSKIEVATIPNKTSYSVGESLDTTGLTLKLAYSDSTSKTVTNGFTVSGFDSSSAGTKTVTVTYEGKTATFTVTVTEPEPEIDENAPQIVVSSGSGILGQQVQVAVSLKNNPGITSMLITVVYDTDVLQLVSVEDCEKLGIAFHSDNLASPYTLSWANDTATSNYVVDGDIVVLTFNVLDTAALGETAINISYDYDNYDIIDKDMNPIRFTTLSGNYTIRDVLVGDVNGDGKVNTLDRVVLTRYIAKWAGYTANDICIEAADVNGDGKVNTLDRVILTRYIAKWNGYTELPYAG